MIREKPGGTSAPSSSTVEAGTVGTAVNVGRSVGVAGAETVSVGREGAVGVGTVDVTVVVAGWQATSKRRRKTENTLNKLSLVTGK